MNFSLDYDDTITAEPLGFLRFCKTMRQLGHKVYIVTMRYPSECKEIYNKWQYDVDGIFPTSRLAKKPWMDAMNIKIDVWIDDSPRAIHESAVEIWGTASPEGLIVNTGYHEEDEPLPALNTADSFPILPMVRESAQTLVSPSGNIHVLNYPNEAIAMAADSANGDNETFSSHYISLDVESRGLHGSTLSFGMLFYSPKGKEIHKAYGQLPLGGRELFQSDDDFNWVSKNVDIMHVTHKTVEGLYRSFLDTLQLWKEIASRNGGSVRLMADCPYPVETNFIKNAVDWYKQQYGEDVDGLYPIIDVASVLLAKGKDPIGQYPRLKNELPAHNPVNDAKQSARIFFEAMGITTS